jgi:FkbM family methyltransferase
MSARADFPSEHPMQPPPRPGDNLHDDLEFILPGGPKLIIDVGCHHGHTTSAYLNRFQESRVVAIEAEAANMAKAREALAPFGERVQLIDGAVAAHAGAIQFHVNSHDGTHSTLPIGELRYWQSHVGETETRTVQAFRLDDLFEGQSIDVLQMDIQGGELEALRGAERLMAQGQVKAIYLEVEFHPLYKGQPLFWEIGAFLAARGYHLYSLYDRHYHANNPRVMSWSDALFLSSALLELPEHRAE